MRPGGRAFSSQVVSLGGSENEIKQAFRLRLVNEYESSTHEVESPKRRITPLKK
jgi:hypothetical protein